MCLFNFLDFLGEKSTSHAAIIEHIMLILNVPAYCSLHYILPGGLGGICLFLDYNSASNQEWTTSLFYSSLLPKSSP